MSAMNIIQQAKAAGVLLFVENKKLGFKVLANGNFDAELKAQVIAHKADIMALLDSSEQLYKVIPLADGQQTLFVVPGADSSASSFAPLAEKLSPMYGLHALDTAQGISHADSSVSVLAQHYAHLLLEDYPQATYKIAGYCVGACIAFELALALEAAGKQVELTIIESFLTAYEGEAYTQEELDEVCLKLQQGATEEARQHFMETYKARSLMALNYYPGGQLQGNLYFLYCHRSIELRSEKDVIIDGLEAVVAGEIVQGMISGNHYSVLSEDVDGLAQALLNKDYLDEPVFHTNGVDYKSVQQEVAYRCDVYWPQDDLDSLHRVDISGKAVWEFQINRGHAVVNFDANVSEKQWDSHTTIHWEALVECIKRNPIETLASALLNGKVKIHQGEILYHVLWLVFGITDPDKLFNFMDAQDSRDQALKVDTDGIKHSRQQLADSSWVTRYMPAHYSVIDTALHLLPMSLKNVTYIDLGCGKGRSLLCAANFPFHKIMGVEINPALASIARKNCSLIGRDDIEVKVGDALAMNFPQTPVVIYSFDTFDQQRLSRWLASLKEQDFVMANPVWILQVNGNRQPYEDCRWLQPVVEKKAVMGSWNITLWQAIA
ncbi:thioesterase domain-containing protein [Pleionea sp. CnH1-48]|uniref:thioesterase domain-containing protein n=1 Tax=Pleionea sp. CnH1-48 TaxID=2954494 RepID=UPI0020975D58|nr:thioesterase domain-containing protein [Pleionea sp. CnH1-48]MCO7224321.1 thioesterase domain-containing protein [Pleionea sp. CnH1-48]